MPLRRKICRWFGTTVRRLRQKPKASILDGDRGGIEEALAAITTRECLRPSAESATAFLNRFAASNAEVARRYLNRENGMLFTNAPRSDQPTRLPTLDVGQAVAISVALWQWQDARLRATLTKESARFHRNSRSPLILPIFRSRRARLLASDAQSTAACR